MARKNIVQLRLNSDEIKGLINQNKIKLRKQLNETFSYSKNEYDKNYIDNLYTNFVGGINCGFFGKTQSKLIEELNINDVVKAMDAVLANYYNQALEYLILYLKNGNYVFERIEDLEETYYYGKEIGIKFKNLFEQDPDFFIASRKKLYTPHEHLKRILKNDNKRMRTSEVPLDIYEIEYMVQEHFASITGPNCVLNDDGKNEMIKDLREKLNSFVSTNFPEEQRYAGPLIGELYKGFYNMSTNEVLSYLKEKNITTKSKSLPNIVVDEQRDMIVVMYNVLYKLIQTYGTNKYKNITDLIIDAKLIGLSARMAYVDNPIVEINDSIYVDEDGKNMIDKRGYSKKRIYK